MLIHCTLGSTVWLQVLGFLISDKCILIMSISLRDQRQHNFLFDLDLFLEFIRESEQQSEYCEWNSSPHNSQELKAGE